MHDDAPTAEVAGFLRQAASAFPAEAPAPGPQLALLMAAGLPAPVASVRSTPTRSPSMIRTALSALPGKLALAAVGVTFATAGLGVASALPGPLQDVADGIGDVVGVDLPVTGGATTTTTEATTTPTTERTTTAKTARTTPTTAETTPTTVGATVPTGGAVALPPAATTAAQAAHIHDFDEACGNHGSYVSSVARNGTEPSCAAEVRTGTTTPPTTTGSSTTTVGPDTSGSSRRGPANQSGKGKGTP